MKRTRFKFTNAELTKWHAKAKPADRVSDLGCTSLIARADRLGITFEWYGRTEGKPTRVRLAMFSTATDPNAPFAFTMAAHAKPGLLTVPLALMPATLTISEARAVATTMSMNARAGHNPKAAIAKPEVITVAKALDRYERDHQRHKRQGAEVMRHLQQRMAPVLARPLVEITKRDLLDLIQPLADNRKWARAHRLRTDLGGFMNWCEDHAIVPDFVSPARRLKLAMPAPKRDHVPQLAECQAIYAGAARLTVHGKPDIRRRVFVRLLMLTACRRDEIADLLWSEVGEDTVTIPAARYKSCRAHTLPLTDAMKAELDLLPRNGARVFGRMGNMGLIKERVQAASGTSGWVFHDLRRAFATHTVCKDHPREIIEKALGHVIPGTEGIYNRADRAAEVKAALERWEGLLTAANVVEFPVPRTA
jgi:integrase